jgi:beta-lactamase class D
MKNVILFLSLVLFGSTVFAETKCFLVKENDKIIMEEGDCKTRYAPESTFKIPLSLIGYDAGIFEDENTPEWPCKEGYDYYINVCKSPHNPRSWIRDSCVWYSQLLTKQLGIKKFQDYITKFNYGNMDLSGDKGKNNGLTNSWLSSSLEISPEEQVAFLQKIVNHQLPISKKSYQMAKSILFREELSGGWMLYGKTGNGRQLSSHREKLDLRHGWFVGWIEKNGRILTFASHITDDKQYDTFASFRIRDEARNKLWYLINDLEE